MEDRQVQYTMRVKIPEGTCLNILQLRPNYHELCLTILNEKPSGFEVDWDSKGTWPIDAEGYTWVKLYRTDSKLAIEFWMRKCACYEAKLSRIKEIVESIRLGV